ncbi:MAG: amidohydrolase family protein [Duodenibacillus sp.]|nr:amidohydrolase family protein [Duodenibacillus sp.]
MTAENARTVREMIEPVIMARGGWVNTHAHADRAFTLSPEILELRRTCTLQQKWDALDRLKRESTVEDFYNRFSMFFELMIRQGCRAVATFVDIDPMAEDRAITAGLRAREHFEGDITVKFANQTLKGVIDPEARRWFDIGAGLVDIIGGLPKRDERDFGRAAEATDILLETAKARGQMVHCHVDQFNMSSEYETEMLARKTIEHGMQGRVVAIHSISVGAHSKAYRQALYELLKEAGVMVVCCPTAWIDTARSEAIGPMHNSMTPVDEMVPAGVTVALGTDNVCDAMVPWSAGDMWHELQLLATGCRYDDFEQLVNIATDNGRKVLGI